MTGISELTFGHYELEGLVGRGGMGEVHRAFDTVKRRRVALKLLAPHLASDETFQERFRRESELAARLREPHVIPIHDYGEIEGRLFIDMRLVDGRDLQTVISENGALAPIRAATIITQIAGALDAAHADGLVHRDVKPSNILLTGSGGTSDFAYLVDFGIASATSGDRLTRTGTTLGSVLYMAPELFDAGDRRDSRIDVYSLAGVLHTILTGHSPFDTDGYAATVYAHLRSAPPRPTRSHPHLPSAIDDVIARGMAKNPDDRYATAGELAEAAQAALVGKRAPLPAAPATEEVTIQHPRPPAAAADRSPALAAPRRRKALVIGLAALVVAGLVAAGVTIVTTRPTADAPVVVAAPPTTVPADPPNTYVDKHGRFRLVPPSGWKETVAAQGLLTFISPTPAANPSGAPFEVGIAVAVFTSVGSLDQVVDASRTTFQVAPGIKLGMDARIKLEDGTPAHLFTYTVTPPGSDLTVWRAELVAVRDDTTLFTVSGTSLASETADNQQILTAARTLRVTR
ncbi:serine/threonine-protein kinase [Pseudonocardia sp. TRM90224]|uniref:serine/threonine-protein kinase n=1 Tax=Pseudonocardia sp. TRM90224 TaxID=2812678 RepID=UPI001E406AA5|nr:serine/threonine-protein kinase [Pseudonocardia sp. TRM90224]